MVDRSRSGRRTILIVDGDPAWRARTAAVLEDAGFAVVAAPSGEEALAAFADHAVGLVLLEVQLPGISGYELCHRLRERYGAGLPIVFVSGGFVEPEDRVAGLLLGADDYLAKPVAAAELVARLRNRLRRPARDDRRGLTPREREVVGLLADGLGPVEIGGRLGISPKTVATHVEHIYAKLGVHTRAQAVAAAFRRELV
jgi:DNA-binding NarL/FixJ family response regulator